MNEENLNAEIEEVVQPQNNGAEDTEVSQGAITNPQNVEDMSDEEFDEYLNSVQNGTISREVQATESDDNTTDNDDSEAGNTEPGRMASSEAKRNDQPGRMASSEAKRNDQSEEDTEKPFRVFKSQQEYQSEIDRIMGERLKKNRESINTLQELEAQALNFYGGEDGGSAVSQLIADLQSQNAERKGISVEDYNKQTQDSIDAEKYRNEQERIHRQQEEINNIKSRWNKESEELKSIIPDFDFEMAMRNRTFYEAVVKGSSISTAYLIANKAQAETQVEKPKRKPIRQNGATKNSGIGKVDRNIDAMSDDEFANYIEKLKG